jgi:glucokinase
MRIVDAIGIDLGGSKVSAGVVSPSGGIGARRARPRPATPSEMLRSPSEIVHELLDEHVGAIGLGVAGLVTEAGVLEWGPNVIGEHLAFLETLAGEFGVPTVVDNDANLATFAEARLGAGRGYRVVVMVTLGTGIGGGMTIDGEIYRGRAFAGEMGHMVVDVGGPLCTCGQQGCWETFASGRRLDQMARDAVADHPAGRIAGLAAGETPAGRHLTSAALEGDEQAQALVAEVAGWLGVGLSTLIALLDPDVIVIGGGVSRLGDVLLRPTRRAIATSLEGYDVRTPTPIVTATFGEDATVVGAGLAALRKAHV